MEEEEELAAGARAEVQHPPAVAEQPAPKKKKRQAGYPHPSSIVKVDTTFTILLIPALVPTALCLF